ncbi:Putative glycosyltransferase EpsH [Vibrio aerogenes CECT 7868]|uniref:Putative glycosyltransferase EpsH n=1 Tax=Vibrio aerogenes CECT 7868 TaxID=1216006 RepID=A0A1M5ZBV6_9VIBR|nr:glycosyltransferase family 2 protein [Vibrio aerogenes]SHI21680.1 Putative glycosyltransferase EpsH [Vibrio aerogenes CECT 7868]
MMRLNGERSDLISVIIPVYNVEKYLAECLQSVIVQSYPYIEIICVIDGSKDNSFNIARYYQMCDDRIKIIWQENQGLSGARNTGLKVAQGDFIFFLDSDDSIEPDAITLLHQHIDHYDIVCGGITCVEEETGARYPYKKNRTIGEVDFNRKFYALETVVWNKLYRKEVFTEIRFTRGLIYEDLELYWRLYSHPVRVYCIPEDIYHYRIRENSIMTKSYSGDETHQEHHIHITRVAYSAAEKDRRKRYLFYKLCIKFLNDLDEKNSPKEKYEQFIYKHYKISRNLSCLLRMKIYKLYHLLRQ